MQNYQKKKSGQQALASVIKKQQVSTLSNTFNCWSFFKHRTKPCPETFMIILFFQIGHQGISKENSCYRFLAWRLSLRKRPKVVSRAEEPKIQLGFKYWNLGSERPLTAIRLNYFYINKIHDFQAKLAISF